MVTSVSAPRYKEGLCNLYCLNKISASLEDCVLDLWDDVQLK